jgi:hypothetical protein
MPAAKDSARTPLGPIYGLKGLNHIMMETYFFLLLVANGFLLKILMHSEPINVQKR